MKTRILTVSLMLMAVLLFSCKKDKVESSGPQEVSFQADQIIPNGGLKSTSAFDVQCSDIAPTNAHIKIGSATYDPSVYKVDGKLYTQAIKLDPGSYSVTQFFLYQDIGTPGYDAGDKIVMATPEAGSSYAAYTTPDLAFDFTVSAFAKTQVPIQVLCFDPNEYTNFGFGWFTIGEVILREACFFGDICIANPALYAGSIYATNGVNVDEVAVTQVIVKRDGVEVPNSPFNNYATYGAAAPLCVQYPDYVGQIDNFTFELQVWVPSTTPGIFKWQTYKTLTTADATPILGVGAQGVFDYAIGTCSPNSTNIYTWLAPPAGPPTPTVLLEGDYAVVSSAVENQNLAGLRYEIINNGDGTVTFNLWPTLFVGSPMLKALTVGIVNQAGTFSQDITYGSSDGTLPADELVSVDGGVKYSYTAPAGTLTTGEVGIFLMVNGRAPDNGNDLQRWIGITPMYPASNFAGFDWSWANRFKITLP